MTRGPFLKGGLGFYRLVHHLTSPLTYQLPQALLTQHKKRSKLPWRFPFPFHKFSLHMTDSIFACTAATDSAQLLWTPGAFNLLYDT